jgi:OOP family OmpA-OmpF porin
MRKAILLAGLASLFHVGAAQADSGIYVGAGVGQVALQDEDDDLGLELDASDVSFKVFAGYQITEYFAIELAYMDGGTADDNIEGINIDITTDAIQGSVLAFLPITEQFAFYGRAGLLAWDAEYELSAGNIRVNLEEDGEDFVWGVGGRFSLNNLSFRVEYEAAELEGVDMRNISASIAYRF